METESNNTFWV